MSSVANRRSVMTLFTLPDCIDCHRVRIVLAEKDIAVDIIEIDPDNKPGDLSELNPYNTAPTLIDRDLVLYDARVIMEYLDERFPHPPLMPVDPVNRAHSRLALFRVERDWYSLAAELESGENERVRRARELLRDSVISAAEVFAIKPYFLSNDFSLVDCTIAPILWRLPRYQIDLPASDAKPVMDYMDRVFSRDMYQNALSDAEKAIRP
ncbi:MAG: glutathione S-transferase N-terminal domain-containing protein [Cocleimonas sp.]|nr:glutathione S-transferase N-terminal domain-containing protein [Cocleimonas sp.]